MSGKQSLIAAAIALVVLAAGGYWWLSSSSSKTPTPEAATTTPKEAIPLAQQIKPPRVPPAGYKEFRDKFYKFQMFYPENLTPTLYKEEGSAATIVFENADGSQSFQIFVTPFGGNVITETRFKQDSPSGVIKDQTEATVDGMPATAFFGEVAGFGETREVWFIGRGFLYEVTASKELDGWLLNLMASWQFL